MSYLRRCHFEVGKDGFRPTHDLWAHTYERLFWAYGPSRAREIVMGRDSRAMADVAAWQALGART